MIVVTPFDSIVIRPLVASTVATDGLELLYVIAPALTEVGSTGVNGASPTVLVIPPVVKK